MHTECSKNWNQFTIDSFKGKNTLQWLFEFDHFFLEYDLLERQDQLFSIRRIDQLVLLLPEWP